jgi:hypothetical protein
MIDDKIYSRKSLISWNNNEFQFIYVLSILKYLYIGFDIQYFIPTC